jgi:hypothetical protein
MNNEWYLVLLKTDESKVYCEVRQTYVISTFLD